MNAGSQAVAMSDMAEVSPCRADDHLSLAAEHISHSDNDAALRFLQKVSGLRMPYVSDCLEEGILITQLHTKKMIEAKVREINFDAFAGATVVRIRPRGFAMLQTRK